MVRTSAIQHNVLDCCVQGSVFVAYGLQVYPLFISQKKKGLKLMLYGFFRPEIHRHIEF
jgi:hypothetical protein